MGLAAFMAGQPALDAVKSTGNPTVAAPEWTAAQSLFAGLEKLGLPDVRGAQLVRQRRRGWAHSGGEGLGLSWLFAPENQVSARVIRDQVDVTEVRLWGLLARLLHQSGQPAPDQVRSASHLPSFDGEYCDASQAVAMVRENIPGKRSEAAGNDRAEVTRTEVEAFLLAANLYRSGREQPARQVLQLLGTSGGRMQALAAQASGMVVRARTTALVRQHLQQPNWTELATALGELLAVVPAACSDRDQLDRLARLAETRGYDVFGDDDRYLHLSEPERALVNRLASEVPAWQLFRNSLWVACEWGGEDNSEQRPGGALGEVLLQGPASLPMLAACLGDQRPILLAHDMMQSRQAAAVQSMPMLATMDELARALLVGQVPPGDLPETADPKERTNALRQWCLRAAGQSRLVLAKRILEAGDEHRRVEATEWLALREASGKGLEIFREWLPRQPDDWMRVQGFLLLYDALGRHGSKLKDVLASVRPRLLAMEEPVDVAQRAIGHAWEVRRELAVLDRMAAAPSPLEGILAVIAEGSISTSRCRERLPLVFHHTPPEENIAAVLAALPRFRWTCEADRVLLSLRRSGGHAGGELQQLQHRRPPVAYEGLRDAWETVFADQRELFTCLPQFSTTLGEAAAWACLAIHGAEDRPRHMDFPMIRELGEPAADIPLAQALLRGEIKVRGAAPTREGPVFTPAPTQIPPTFVLGRFVATPASERTAFFNKLPAEERAVLRTFLVAPHSLYGGTDLPPSVRAEMCASARTIHVLAPTGSEHPLRRLEGQNLSDDTLAEILRETVDSLANGRNEVTTLRLNDTLDGVTLVSRPLDLAAMAMEVVSSGGGVETWITQWLQYGPLGPDAESMSIDERRVLVVSLISRGISFPAYPVALTQRLLEKSFLPPVETEKHPLVGASAGDTYLVRGDVDNDTQTHASLLLWRNLRALLKADSPAVDPEPGAPAPPPLIPCEGIVLWSFDPVAMRAALAQP